MVRAITLVVSLLCLSAASKVIAQPSPAPAPSSYPSIAAAARANNLTYLLAAAQALNIAVDPTEPYTILAPVNSAFESVIEQAQVDVPTFLSSPGLGSIIAYHFIPGAVRSSDLTDSEIVTTLLGENLTISIGQTITIEGEVNNATVLTPDVTAGQNIIHVINAVLIPTEQLSAPLAPTGAPQVALAEETLGVQPPAPAASTTTTGRKLLFA